MMSRFRSKTILLLVLSVICGSPSNATSLIYANQGQSQAQQDKDISECNAQARQQSGLDPRRPLGNDANASREARQKRQQDLETYNQVLATCLRGRGYTVE